VKAITSILTLSMFVLAPASAEARDSGSGFPIPEQEYPTTDLFDTPEKTTKAPELPGEIIDRAGPATFDTSGFLACPVDVEADGAFTCILRGDGTAECFGSYAPKPTGAFVDIDTGRSSFCGVRVDGSLYCSTTSTRFPNTANTPAPGPPALPFRQVSAAIDHACAVDVVGQVTCWGEDRAGQVSGAPAGFGYVEVAAAADQTCALRTNGAVDCWGTPHFGTFESPPPESFVRIDADTWTICGVASNGGLYCWGASSGPSLQDFAPGGSFAAVDVGVYDGCALEPDGTPRCWSPHSGNQFGAGDPALDEKFVDVAVGYHHACGLTADHRILCWGRNSWGEGSPPTTWRCDPDATVEPEYGYEE
jgi:alpha-tubulin suppressor-like RCC1 family protein